MITFRCSFCGATYKVATDLAGAAIQCRKSREWDRVPGKRTADVAEEAANDPSCPDSKQEVAREAWTIVITIFLVFIAIIGFGLLSVWVGSAGSSGSPFGALLIVLVVIGFLSGFFGKKR